MTERLLQYIWQFQYFNAAALQTRQGDDLQIISPGLYNSNQGPDFQNGKIKVNGTVWAGNIELHTNASDWTLHNHSQDKNYDNVILHVVWNDDIDPGLPFPTFELRNRVSKLLLAKYAALMEKQLFIPCEKMIPDTNELSFIKWKERLVIERLQQKAKHIELNLGKNNQHWQETFWWMLARNFGVRINTDCFEKIAQSIPINILARHKNQPIQIEALLFGQAGLLEKKFSESYPIMLQKEFRFLRKKYRLKPIWHPLYFLRMRPANFPTIRLAQLAIIIQQNTHLFDHVKTTESFTEAAKLFDVTANDYWHYHYVFDEPAAFKEKRLGKEMINNIFINTVIPMLYAYGYVANDETYRAKAISWLEKLTTESNSITAGFKKIGVESKSAFDSQALLQLKNEYCDPRHCLQCAIGNKLLREIG